MASTSSAKIESMFFEPSSAPAPATRKVGSVGGQHKSEGLLKEERRFADAMKRSEYRAYGPKCGCDDSCSCGCMDNQICNCHHFSKGCPTKPNALHERQKRSMRPDMQSARLVSGSTSYGKDRDASQESQEEIKYGDITASLEYSDSYYGNGNSMAVARGDKRLPQESNTRPLNMERQQHQGNGAYGVEPAGGGKGRVYLNETSESSSDPQTSLLMSPNDVRSGSAWGKPQSYSSVPQSGKISSACNSCSPTPRGGNF